MKIAKLGWGSLIALLGLLALAVPSAVKADVIPSKAEEAAPGDSAGTDRDRVEAVFARQDVAQALAAHGIAPLEVERRLAQLSPQDLRSLAAHVDQVQAAGNVPNYIWILLGILLAVTILAAVF